MWLSGRTKKLKKLDRDAVDLAISWVESVTMDYTINEYGSDMDDAAFTRKMWQTPIDELLNPSDLFAIWAEGHTEKDRHPASDYFAEDETEWQKAAKLWNATRREMRKMKIPVRMTEIRVQDD